MRRLSNRSCLAFHECGQFLWSYETFEDVQEIHELSGGRPYEIQLICHFLFRRIQEGRATRMELTVDILDDVRKELETSQDITIRPILKSIRNYDAPSLLALDLLCSCSGHASFDQIWFGAYTFLGDKRWGGQSLHEKFTKFQDDGVITVQNGTIEFLGDEFDRIYCKYLARKRDASLIISDLPFEVFLVLRLDTFLRRLFKHLQPISATIVGSEEKPDFVEIGEMLATADAEHDIFKINPAIAESLYWEVSNSGAITPLMLLSLQFKLPGSTSGNGIGLRTKGIRWSMSQRLFRNARGERPN